MTSEFDLSTSSLPHAAGTSPRIGEPVDRMMLDRAALAGLRAWGYAEPNPLVGCVIGRRVGGRHADVLSIAHHQHDGQAHAEQLALDRARTLGVDVSGATAWVTLEPCVHVGRTPSCAAALLQAGITEVVYAQPDPHDIAAGGAAWLGEKGVNAWHCSGSAAANQLARPFIERIGRAPARPWVIAKWAQTLDGWLATRTGSSKWISCAASRRRVHALRGRCDAVITGIGTVLSDDPLLTPRDVFARRQPVRVVLDPRCNTPLDAAIVTSAREHPVIIVCTKVAANSAHADALCDAGCELLTSDLEGDGDQNTLCISTMLQHLAADHGVHTAMLEAGPGVLGSAMRDGLIDEAWVFIAPTLLGDGRSLPVGNWRAATSIQDGTRLETIARRASGRDTLLIFRRPAARTDD